MVKGSRGDDARGRPVKVANDREALPDTLRPDDTIRLDADAVRRHQRSSRKGSLLVIDGIHADVGSHLVVDTRVTIGRDAHGLLLHDPRISRRHAVVEAIEGGHVLHDLGSTNGTLLNGAPVTGTHPLGDGDKIYVGQTVIKFTLVDETEASYLHRIAQLAGTDELTGLLAKHRFDSLLQEAVRTAELSGAPLSLLMMDLDGIKAINDANGHQMGARTIRLVGQLLGRIVVGHGEACRFGGDEFCAFLPATDLAAAMRLGQRICDEVRDLEVTLGERTVKATISVGVAEWDLNMGQADRLLAAADEALYRAKAGGRNIVCA